MIPIFLRLAVNEIENRSFLATKEDIMDKILRIDVGAAGGPKATEVPVGEYAGLGGRAMTSAIVSKEVPPLCHPLGGGEQAGHRARAPERDRRRPVGPDLRGLQEPAHRRHQGVELRRTAFPGPGKARLQRHRARRETDERRPLQGLHQQGRGQDHQGQQPQDAPQLRSGREDEEGVRRQDIAASRSDLPAR